MIYNYISYVCELNIPKSQTASPVMTQGRDRIPVPAATKEASYVPLSSLGSTCSTRWSIDTVRTHSLISSLFSTWNTDKGKVSLRFQ